MTKFLCNFARPVAYFHPFLACHIILANVGFEIWIDYFFIWNNTIFNFPLGFSCNIWQISGVITVNHRFILQIPSFFCCKPWWFLHKSCKFSLSLTFFFFFSSAFFMRISSFFVIWLRRYLDPPKSPEHWKQFQKFFSLPVIHFSAMLVVVKMDKGATHICCWWYVFMQMGTHHLKQFELPI